MNFYHCFSISHNFRHLWFKSFPIIIMYFIQILIAVIKGVIVMSMENKFVRHLIYLGQRKTASNIVNFVDMVLQHSISNCKTDFQYQMCSSKSKVHDVIFFSIFDTQTSTKIIKFVWICLLYYIVLCCRFEVSL